MIYISILSFVGKIRRSTAISADLTPFVKPYNYQDITWLLYPKVRLFKDFIDDLKGFEVVQLLHNQIKPL